MKQLLSPLLFLIFKRPKRTQNIFRLCYFSSHFRVTIVLEFILQRRNFGIWMSFVFFCRIRLGNRWRWSSSSSDPAILTRSQPPSLSAFGSNSWSQSVRSAPLGNIRRLGARLPTLRKYDLIAAGGKKWHFYLLRRFLTQKVPFLGSSISPSPTIFFTTRKNIWDVRAVQEKEQGIVSKAYFRPWRFDCSIYSERENGTNLKLPREMKREKCGKSRDVAVATFSLYNNALLPPVGISYHRWKKKKKGPATNDLQFPGIDNCCAVFSTSWRIFLRHQASLV